jgi:hypothetical protein
MAGVPFMQLGPDTVEVSVPVAAGQGLEPDTSNPGMFKPWGAGSTRVLGWARTPAVPAGTNAQNNYAPVPRTTGLQWVGDIRVVYLAAAALGDWLVAGANGTVTPAASQSAPGVGVVGRCTEPKGVLAGATGRCRSLL